MMSFGLLCIHVWLLMTIAVFAPRWFGNWIGKVIKGIREELSL